MQQALSLGRCSARQSLRLARLGHELSNALAIVRGNAELLSQQDSLPLPARESIDEILRAAERVHELTLQFGLLGTVPEQVG